jgi:hypothetical protein
MELQAERSNPAQLGAGQMYLEGQNPKVWRINGPDSAPLAGRRPPSPCSAIQAGPPLRPDRPWTEGTYC